MTTAAHDDAVALGRRLGVALSDEEIGRIADHLGRIPTATELFAFDAQWSEHCSYKSSREHLKKLPTQGPTVLLGVGEDAGIVRLGEWEGETYGIVVAHESHNHPSQVVPFEGAATGIGGIVRDVLCMGAEVIGVADPLRFGRLENEHCRYVAQQVVDGIAAYGNAIGVPNVGGDVFFDESFNDNVLVNVVALGLVKEKDIIHSRAPKDSLGWDIVLVGKATDRSGFGGASFSSLSLDEEDAEQNKGAVQVPDPFLKNVIMRASYAVFAELRKQGITAGFKDLGAGGLAGCSAELCAAGGMGAEVALELVSTAQKDLPPEVIAIGETQERLCWIVPPAFTPTLLSIYNELYSLPRVARGACAAVIGKVADTGRYVARYHGDVVMDVDLDFLTGGVRYSRPFELPPTAPESDAADRAVVANFDRPLALLTALPHLLGHRDVASRVSIYQRYDGVVRGVTSLPPGYADAGVLVPVPGAPLGVAVGIGGNPRYGKLDPRRAGALAVVEAVAQVSAVGATPAGLTDCLNFGDPTIPSQMGAFVAAVDGLSEAARGIGVPFVSGNVSLYNRSSSGNHVAPSPIVSCIGTLADVAVARTMGFKHAGSPVVVLNGPAGAFGGSVIADVLGVTSRALPAVDLDWFTRASACVRAGLQRGVILAARDISDGGPLTAAVEMAMASTEGFGLRIGGDGVASAQGRASQYDETPGYVVEVGDFAAFIELAAQHRLAIRLDMRTIAEPLVEHVDADGDRVAAIALDDLRRVWEEPLRDFYGAAGAA
ncbi:MAG TPA: phosphoribosylformylglycinamidine synthase subunit PurL [Candidatus Elarobacter sp.]